MWPLRTSGPMFVAARAFLIRPWHGHNRCGGHPSRRPQKLSWPPKRYECSVRQIWPRTASSVAALGPPGYKKHGTVKHGASTNTPEESGSCPRRYSSGRTGRALQPPKKWMRYFEKPGRPSFVSTNGARNPTGPVSPSGLTGTSAEQRCRSTTLRPTTYASRWLGRAPAPPQEWTAGGWPSLKRCRPSCFPDWPTC